MTMTSGDSLRRARQRLETEQLFGQEFIPRPVASCPQGEPSDRRGPAPGAAPSESLESIEARFQEVFPLGEQLAGATQPVFGEGNPEADLMFIGEAPGADEDRVGRPFVGAAGRKLDDIIAAMGFARSEVYIANLLKARPPRNRNPLPDEIADHAPFLVGQIRAIRPKVIVALGRPSAHYLLQTSTPISRLRGVWGRWEDEGWPVDVMPTFHPAFLLRQYTPEVRGQVWSDMQQVISRLQELS